MNTSIYDGNSSNLMDNFNTKYNGYADYLDTPNNIQVNNQISDQYNNHCNNWTIIYINLVHHINNDYYRIHPKLL